MNTKWIVTLIITFIIVMISIVYAFVQTVAAQAAERRALSEKEMADKFRMESMASRAEAERQHQLYLECQAQLEACGKH